MKHNKQNRNRKTRKSHKSLIGITVAVSVLVIGVVTGVSMQGGQSQKAKIEENKPQVAKPISRNYVTVDQTGQTVAVDRQTGKMRPLTQEEASRLAEGVKQLVNRSSEGLVEIHHQDGSVSMNLQGRFQNVMVAKREDDGTITQACLDNIDSAAAFFEIDPALLGAAPRNPKAQSSLKVEDR